MSKQTIIINGENLSDLETFYKEIDRVLTCNIEWATGHNLDAFNDLLRGGLGVYECYEPVKILWINFAKSQENLGDKLIKTLIEIIQEHKHIDLIIQD